MRLAACVLCLASVEACATLAGLDQISESSCAPNCGEDGGVGDAWTSTSPDASALRLVEATADVADGRPAFGDQDAADALSDATPAEASDDTDGFVDAGPATDASSPSDASPVDAEAGGRRDADTDAGSCGTVYFSDSFDDNAHGWTLDPTWSIAPTCASPPMPQKGNPDPEVDHTTGPAGGVAGAYACGNNPAAQTSPARFVTSPPIDVSAAPAVYLTFYRWLNSDASEWMASTVDVYDGSAWVNVYTNPSGTGNIVADAVWTKMQYDVTAQRSAAFRVRFGYAAVDAGVYSVSCWNVDDVTVSSAACP